MAILFGTQNNHKSMKILNSSIIIMTILLSSFLMCSKEKELDMKLKDEIFGKTEDGKIIRRYILSNKNGMSVKIINYGGIVTNLLLPEKENNYVDVVLGFDDLQSYLTNKPYFGCLVGRYANRIAKGKFILDGKEYKLATNNNENHLHGGVKGFDKVIWQADTINNKDGIALVLKYRSKDGEEGYPGNLDIKVTYSLTNENELKIEYEATTDKPTPVNLTHHSYFNLAGAGNGNILDHEIFINADKYTVVDDNLIPTGEIKSVEGTPLDFRTSHRIGDCISQVSGGYDHNFILNKKSDSVAFAAKVLEPISGRIMEVYTTEPGMQFYTGNFLDSSIIGKKGKTYGKHFGFCLETQHFPDSPNHKEFPSTILYPGQKYHQTTIYKFQIK